MHGNIKDITGQRYGNLVVIELTDLKLPSKRSRVWKCKCDCGNICYKTSEDLKDPRRKTCSCGCKSRAKRTFPNKFVPREHITKVDKIRQEFAEEILTYFSDKSYIEELKLGIQEIIQNNNENAK